MSSAEDIPQGSALCLQMRGVLWDICHREKPVSDALNTWRGICEPIPSKRKGFQAMEIILTTEQKQILSQKMIQSSEILQMASSQLSEYLNEQLLENPVMELTETQPEQLDKKELEKYQWICSHDEQNRYLYQKVEAPDDGQPEWNVDAEPPESLSSHLWSQILTKALPPEWEAPLKFLLDSLDHRGYFTDSIEEFASRFDLSAQQAEDMLSLIQSLEPAGVGARSLEECLCLQLKREGILTPELEQFIQCHLKELAKNQLPAISKSMKLPIETIKEFSSRVRTLNPKPGALFSDSRQTSYIVPDVVIVKFKGHFDILLNESLYPDITVSKEYMQMLQKQEDQEVQKYLLDKIHQTEWLKQCIAQRNATLLSVMQTILNLQKEFFQYGPEGLKPLRMADVAAALNIHESTVSRAVREKYLQCSWGIFPLRYFFAKAAVRVPQSSVSAETGLVTSAGSTVSDIKQAMKKIIAGENKQKPYSDRILTEKLAEQGYLLSRRTVAKYREEEQIPGASGRKVY